MFLPNIVLFQQECDSSPKNLFLVDNLLVREARIGSPSYIIYDSLFEIGRCLTEIYSSLKFCQTVILCDFLSDTDEFLSYFIEFLSNTGVTLTVCYSVKEIEKMTE